MIYITLQCISNRNNSIANAMNSNFYLSMAETISKQKIFFLWIYLVKPYWGKKHNKCFVLTWHVVKYNLINLKQNSRKKTYQLKIRIISGIGN